MYGLAAVEVAKIVPSQVIGHEVNDVRGTSVSGKGRGNGKYRQREQNARHVELHFAKILVAGKRRRNAWPRNRGPHHDARRPGG